MELTYIDIMNGFNDWCYDNSLDGKTQLVFIKILHLINKGGWQEWTEMSNFRLMDLTTISSETSFCRHRNTLIELGFIAYRKGKKGKPNKYKILKENFVKIRNKHTVKCTVKNSSTSESTNDKNHRYTVKRKQVSSQRGRHD